METRKFLVAAIAIVAGIFATGVPGTALAADCNASLPFSYNGTCYATLEAAEAVMRGTNGPTGSEQNQDWRIYFELKTPPVNGVRKYHLPPRPHLPNPSWRTFLNRKWGSWTWSGFSSPYFGSYADAEDWLDQYAGIPSKEGPAYSPAFNQLVYRGTWNGSRFYSDVLFDSYPLAVDLSQPWWMSCNDFIPGTINSKAGQATHSLYQPESMGPPPLLYRNFVGSCDVGGVTYKFWPINVTSITQVSAGLCQTPYASDGTQCVSGLEATIVEGGTYSVVPPEQDG
ncbi:MAG: hypothetical protein RLN69_04505, partial [Woeseiaceae bacterium]